MNISPRTRAILLAAGLLFTLAASFFSPEGDGKARQNSGKDRLAVTEHSTAKNDDGDEVPTINIHHNPPVKEVTDVFRNTSWYVPPPPPKPAPPSPPPIPFTYIGMMKEESGNLAFLSKQDNSYAVRPGDLIEGNYRVDKVGEQELVLTYLPLDIKQNIYIGSKN